MLNLVIDMGNSRIKAGLFQNSQLVRELICSDLPTLGQQLAGVEIQNVLVSSVRAEAGEIPRFVPVAGKHLVFSAQTPVPIQNGYGTPGTLGVDRLAAAVGAAHLFPQEHCLVMDAGTCITYDVLDAAGVFQGGVISPGIQMRYQAMHTFTGKLPLLNGHALPTLPARNTADAMRGGVLYGVLAEAEGIMQHYEQRYNPLKVILCGGDAPFFESTVKARIFVIPELVLIGLNRILEHNV